MTGQEEADGRRWPPAREDAEESPLSNRVCGPTEVGGPRGPVARATGHGGAIFRLEQKRHSRHGAMIRSPESVDVADMVKRPSPLVQVRNDRDELLVTDELDAKSNAVNRRPRKGP